MNPKIINREVKTITTFRSNETIKYDDGSTKKTAEFKDYLDNEETPFLVYKKVEYIDPNGEIDKNKSFFYKKTPDGSSYSEIKQEHSDSD